MTKIQSQLFSKTPDGRDTHLFILDNGTVTVKITDFGGTIVSILAPDKNGRYADVVLGYDSIAEYASNAGYVGALIGRVGNRIAEGKFTLNGITYQLNCNEGKNHLHGGNEGFDRKIWTAEIIDMDGCDQLELHYLSRDGEEHYPGNLQVTVTYALTDDNRLTITYCATTDKDTILNLTNHTYFNLAGHDSGSVENHEIKILGDQVTATDDKLIITGKLDEVAGTPFDFTEFHKIGERIHDDFVPLVYGNGYDANWVLRKFHDPMPLVCEVVEPESGRKMNVYTNQPGIQFYTGNAIGGTRGKGGVIYQKHQGFCLETQHFPDGINHPNFPSFVLKPGEIYDYHTEYPSPTR